MESFGSPFFCRLRMLVFPGGAVLIMTGAADIQETLFPELPSQTYRRPP
jgi:hypothetical protein